MPLGSALPLITIHPFYRVATLKATLDAMSDAVEGSACILYGVSKQYKESANCRLEAMYGTQCGVDMIPLMMEEGYRSNGWLGIIMGTRLWYAVHFPL
jgi:male-specific lethal 1